MRLYVRTTDKRKTGDDLLDDAQLVRGEVIRAYADSWSPSSKEAASPHHQIIDCKELDDEDVASLTVADDVAEKTYPRRRIRRMDFSKLPANKRRHFERNQRNRASVRLSRGQIMACVFVREHRGRTRNDGEKKSYRDSKEKRRDR